MTWAFYLLQVNIYVVIFYVFYRIFLDRETWFILNRFYLLSAATLSMLIPFIKPEWILPEAAHTGITISAGQLDMLVADASVAAEPGISWGGIISTVYICGLIFFAARLIWRLFHVSLMIHAKPEGMAFSFFGRKIIDRNLPGQEAIHRHEDIHIRQYHTADVIYFELLGILLWCNPVIYLYQNSIKNIHEYLADEVAARLEGDKESYAMLLLCKAFKVDQSVLTNSFFTKSLIKKRIIMLNKQRSTKTAILKYGLFLPLFAGMLLLSSAKISRNEDIKDLAEQIPATIPVPSLFNAVSEHKPATGLFSAEPAEAAALTVQQDTTKKRVTKKAVNSSTSAPVKATTQSGDQATANTNDEKVFDFVSIDTQPTFPGGMDKFYRYLSAAVRYPKEAQDKNVQGKVFLSFIVEKDGRIAEVKTERGLGSGLDEEAERVLNASPKWAPGKRGDQPVRVKYHVPINFALGTADKNGPNTNKAPEVKSIITTPEDAAQTTTLRISSAKDPLIYLDDNRISAAALKKIDPKMIESISVVKDKTMLAKYGAEAEDGLILIVSKKTK